MKFSYKLSDAIHILAYLEINQNDVDLSSRMIASSIEANPSVVRNLMRDLKAGGMINTQQGSARPSLAKDPAKISLLEVYQALDMNQNLLHVDPKTNPNCLVGANIQDTLDEAYRRVEEVAFQEMAQVTIQDIVDGIVKRSNNVKK